MATALELANHALDVIEIIPFTPVQHSLEIAYLEVSPWKSVKRLPEGKRPNYMQRRVGEVAAIQLLSERTITTRNFREIEKDVWVSCKNVLAWLKVHNQELKVSGGVSRGVLVDNETNPTQAYYSIGAVSPDPHIPPALLELNFGSPAS